MNNFNFNTVTWELAQMNRETFAFRKSSMVLCHCEE